MAFLNQSEADLTDKIEVADDWSIPSAIPEDLFLSAGLTHDYQFINVNTMHSGQYR